MSTPEVPARPATTDADSAVMVDLAIIGSGAGAALTGPHWSGRRVALIESRNFGGIALSTGGLPHALLGQVATQARGVGQASECGLGAVVYSMDWPKIQARVAAAGEQARAAGEQAVADAPGHLVVRGKARFLSPREIVVESEHERTIINARHTVIATGSHPVLPLAIARSGVTLHTSETILGLAELPDRLIIIGGGAVAAQCAHIFSGLGVPVTVLVRGESMLSKLDPTIREPFNELARAAWDIRYNTEVLGVQATPEGVLTLRLSQGEPLVGSTVLVATGRRASTGDLQLPAAGVPIHSDGRIVTDAFGQTSVPGIWAVGDASSPFQLQHVAQAEARTVAHNILNPHDMARLPHGYVPRVIHTLQPIATVGLTSEQALREGFDVVGVTQPWGATAWGRGVPQEHAVCSIIADRASEQILGAHILGPGAAALVQPLLQAMEWGTRVGDLARGQYWPTPGPTDPLLQALLGLDARLRSSSTHDQA